MQAYDTALIVVQETAGMRILHDQLDSKHKSLMMHISHAGSRMACQHGSQVLIGMVRIKNPASIK